MIDWNWIFVEYTDYRIKIIYQVRIRISKHNPCIHIYYNDIVHATLVTFFSK